MLHGALQGLLCGTCRHTGALSRGTRGVCSGPRYLGTQHEKHISPGDSGKGSGKGCRTPAHPGTASGLGNAQQAGHKGCRSCENPALNAPGSVRGRKANKDASPDGSQRLPLPWALPGGNHCWHPRALHTEINSALNSWLKSSPAAPDYFLQKPCRGRSGWRWPQCSPHLPP